MEEYEDIDVTKTEQFTLEKKEGEFGSYEVGEHFIYITKIKKSEQLIITLFDSEMKIEDEVIIGFDAFEGTVVDGIVFNERLFIRSVNIVMDNSRDVYLYQVDLNGLELLEVVKLKSSPAVTITKKNKHHYNNPSTWRYDIGVDLEIFWVDANYLYSIEHRVNEEGELLNDIFIYDKGLELVSNHLGVRFSTDQFIDNVNFIEGIGVFCIISDQVATKKIIDLNRKLVKLDGEDIKELSLKSAGKLIKSVAIKSLGNDKIIASGIRKDLGNEKLEAFSILINPSSFEIENEDEEFISMEDISYKAYSNESKSSIEGMSSMLSKAFFVPSNIFKRDDGSLSFLTIQAFSISDQYSTRYYRGSIIITTIDSTGVLSLKYINSLTSYTQLQEIIIFKGARKLCVKEVNGNLVVLTGGQARSFSGQLNVYLENEESFVKQSLIKNDKRYQRMYGYWFFNDKVNFKNLYLKFYPFPEIYGKVTSNQTPIDYSFVKISFD